MSSTSQISLEGCDQMEGEFTFGLPFVCRKCTLFWLGFLGQKMTVIKRFILGSWCSCLPGTLSLEELNWKSREAPDSGELRRGVESILQQLLGVAGSDFK